MGRLIPAGTGLAYHEQRRREREQGYTLGIPGEALPGESGETGVQRPEDVFED